MTFGDTWLLYWRGSLKEIFQKIGRRGTNSCSYVYNQGKLLFVRCKVEYYPCHARAFAWDQPGTLQGSDQDRHTTSGSEECLKPYIGIVSLRANTNSKIHPLTSLGQGLPNANPGVGTALPPPGGPLNCLFCVWLCVCGTISNHLI